MKAAHLAAAVALGASVLAGPTAGTAVAVADDAYAVPGAATAGSGSTGVLQVRVPAGLSPRRLTGTVTMDPPVAGATLLVGDRRAARLDTRAEQSVSVAVSRADVSNGSIDVAVRVPSAGSCATPTSTPTVSLHGVRFAYEGSERPPTTVGTFFGDDVRRIDVLVDDSSGGQLLEAGLVAVGALSSRYPAQVPVTLGSAETAPQRSGPGRRVVLLRSGPGAVRMAVSRGSGPSTLVVTGSAEGVVEAARTLGSPDLRLVSGSDGTDVTSDAKPTARDLTATFAALGSQIDLSSRSAPTSYTSIVQDTFGGPVDELGIHLSGVHTPVPAGTTARVDAYLNGDLLGSVALGAETVLDADLTAPASVLRAQNGLELRLRSASDSTGCLPALPVEVHVDGGASSVTASRGSGNVRGLQAFPQVLGGVLPVALRAKGVDLVPAAVNAAMLVSALQRTASAPLDVQLVGVDELLDGGLSGLLVGANRADSNDLRAPLRLSSVRLMTDPSRSFSVTMAQPFAALQAVVKGDQDLLVLGSWSSSGSTESLERRTATWVAAQGWGAVGEDYVLTNQDGTVSRVPASVVVPQAEAVDEAATDYQWWLAGGLALLVLVFLAQLVHGRRKRDLRDLVRAQQAADADPAGV